MIICVDASLVIRRVAFPDDLTVQKLWDDWADQRVQLVAPGLLPFEVTNVLYRYQRQAWLSSQTVVAALNAALALPVSLVQDTDLHLSARLLAEKFMLPAAYDAHYLALAERLNSPLWTADKRLFHAIQNAGIQWIKLADTP